MSQKLTELTPDQELILTEVRDEWIRRGLSTEPADRAAAEAGVAKAYRAAGLEPPPLVIWLDSPMAGALGQAIVRNLDQVGAQVGDQVWDQVWAQVWAQVRAQVGAQVRAQVGAQVWAQVRAQVGDQVGDQVWAQVRAQVWAQVRAQVGAQVGAQVRAQVWAQVRAQVGAQVGDQVGDQVWAQVRAQVGDQVGDQVWAQVRAQVWAQVRAQVGAQVGDQVGDQVWDWYGNAIGRWETGWLAFYDAFQRLGIDTSRLEGMRAVESSAGWWWPLRGAVVLTDRPTVIARDKDGRLHNADGPAVLYRDGFSVHAWHGTRVPADLIGGWTTERILAERNTEVRRCAIERLGWPEFIAQSGMTRVGDPVPDPGNAPHELSLWDLPESLRDTYDEAARVLTCVNGSPEPDGSRHHFGLIVPAHHSDPIAAAADLYGWPTEAYRRLEVRR